MKSDAENLTSINDEVPVISEERIVKALDATRAYIAQQEQQRAEFGRLIEVAREEERLLLKLLNVRRGAVVQTQDPNGMRENENTILETKTLALHAVIDELSAAGRPLHISELMRLLQQRRIPIPGAGNQANLIIHLRRDKRLVRPSRGMYALASSGLEDMSTSRRRRRKKRVRVTASSGKD